MPTYTKTITDVQVRSGEMGRQNEIVQTIVVQRVNRAFIDVDQEIKAIQTEGHVPVVNAPYDATPPTDMLWERYALCRSIDYRLLGGGKAVVFTVTYSTLWMEDAKVRGTYVLPSQTSYVARVRSTNIYRTGWTTAPSNTNASADIGGTAVSNGTAAKAEQVPQLQIRVSLTADATLDDMSKVATLNSNYLDYMNSASFAGFAAGTLVCEGFTVQKNGNGFELYDVIFEFLYDKWFHLEQVCDTDEKGYPLLNNSKAPSVVKWKRVARSTVDFNNIFKVGATIDTAWRTRTIDGWWT